MQKRINPLCFSFSGIFALVQEKEIHFDGWELKKSILNTLFQAVKAITGGVTAIKGQLIKGSGYALSHGGKVKMENQCPKKWPFNGS